MAGPTGVRLGDGFPSFMEFGNTPTVGFWEVEVKPLDIDGGEPVDITTMRNATYVTRWHQRLKDTGTAELKAAYDPAVYSTLIAQVNVNQPILQIFPDGSALRFWGFIQKFIPDALVRGQMPTAMVTIVATNLNATKVETAATYYSTTTTGP